MGLASATFHSPREMSPTDRRGRTSGTVKPLSQVTASALLARVSY